MTTSFSDYAKQSSNRVIEMSVVLKDRMQTWADVFIRFPDSQNIHTSAGFVTDGMRQNAMEVLVEVQAPPDGTSALVRIQAIGIINPAADNERYSQVCFDFSIDYTRARLIVDKGRDITREDIATLLHAEGSQLVYVLVSHQSGMDSQTRQQVGARHELDSEALDALSKDFEDELVRIVDTTLAELEKTAQQEAVKR